MVEIFNSVLANPSWLRMSIFVFMLLVMSFSEQLFPKRTNRRGCLDRKLTNIALIFVGSIFVRLTVPMSLAAVAYIWMENSWGILNVVALPKMVSALSVIVIFDFAIYWQHRLFHVVPYFWRIHKVHHADRAFDVTTGLRFHPIEILLSLLFKMCLIIVLGPSPESVLIFEVLLSAAAMFSHSNIRFPLPLDCAIRKIIVTPDMHRIHHSTDENEMNKNFGFFLSVWDPLFGTYEREPIGGHNGMTIGLGAYQDKRPSNLWWCLKLPFLKSTGGLNHKPS